MSISSGSSTRSLPVNGGALIETKGPEWDLRKIYGRERETKIIQNHIDNRSNGTIILKGVSGSGKSSLIESQNYEEKGWIFAPGKFELHRKQEPYSALIDALNSLVDQWTIHNKRAPKCRMGSFRNLLNEDIDFLGNILPKTIRDVKAYLSQAHRCRLEMNDEIESVTQEANVDGNTVNSAFWRILSFLSDLKPIVFFLDDIQWADKASVDAIQAIATTGSIDGLLFVLSYREEEVKEGDGIWKCLEYIHDESEDVETIHITDLDIESVNIMVSSILELDPSRTSKLSKVIHGKTAGNPFFVVQFLQMLRHESFLRFSFSNFAWEWGDIEKLDQVANVSDNVAEVIAASMSKLPLATRLVLKMASCLGKVIPLEIMVDYLGACAKSADHHHVDDEVICEALMGIKLKGLKHVLDDAVKFGILARLNDGETYIWAHDKLQAVAYSMIEEKYRNIAHSGLGRVLWKRHQSNPDDCFWLYTAADQLNRLTNVSDDELCLDIARLNLAACKTSISKSAFFPALEMIQAAAKRLKDASDSWKADYDLSLDVYNSLAELAIRFGSREEALRAATLVDENAKTLEDKSRIQLVFITDRVEGRDRDYKGAAEMIVKILVDYDVKFPSKVLPGQLFMEQKKIRARLGGDPESMLKLPKLDENNSIEDKRASIVLKFLARYVETVLILEKPLQLLAINKIISISQKSGTSPATALALAGFSVTLFLDGQIEEARKMGELAIKLVDSFPLRVGSCHGTVYAWVTFRGVLNQRVQFHNMLDPVLDLSRTSLRNGAIEQGVMGWMFYAYIYFCVGLPLGPLESDLLSFAKEARHFGVAETLKVLFPMLRQVIQNLKVMKPNPTLLKGDIFDQETELGKFKDNGFKMTLRDINSFRLMLACVYQEWDVAEDLVVALEPHLQLGSKMFLRKHHYLVYMGYACIVLATRDCRIKGFHYRIVGKRILKMLKDMMKHGSVNVLPVIKMLEAIESPSKQRFDEAIRNTARIGMVHHAAVVYENAGLYYLKQGNDGLGEYHISEACKFYTEWGATGKSKQLMEKHSFLNSSALQERSSNGNVKGRKRFSISTTNKMKEVTHKFTPATHLGGEDRTSITSTTTQSIASTITSTSSIYRPGF